MLTAQTIMDLGFQGKIVGQILKASKKWNEEQLVEFLFDKTIPPETPVIMVDGSVWQWICGPLFENMFSIGSFNIASKSEKRRWLEQKCVRINGAVANRDDLVPEIIESLVFFSGSKKQITML